MFTNSTLSHTAEEVQGIMNALQTIPGIHGATLSTPDGLAVISTSPQAQQMAAVSGFMLAAASQAALMLNMPVPIELIIQSQYRLICRPFQVGTFNLLLTVMTDSNTNYHRLVTRTVRAIHKTLQN